ncbi:MAG: precorrin-3B C(17)-methyltransferase, partial [Mycobacteriales bacterium]
AEGGWAPASLAALATVAAKRDEPGLVALAAARGLPLTAFPAARLAAVAVPNPSEVVRAAVGTPSVCEAAALAAAGPGGRLVADKRASRQATVALARRPPRGRLALVGLGPGARDLLPDRARHELARASVVVGLASYVESIRDLIRPGTTVLTSDLGAEEERAAAAVEQARAGHAVALVGSGDAGVYAMASPALELLADGEDGPGVAVVGVDVVGVPGITAALAAAALLGAPLGHDFATVSLSDLHTPWPAIERRVRAVAEADLVVAFYNPKSAGRDWQLGAALDLLRPHRPAGTPVGVVRDAGRPGEEARLTTLAAADPEGVDMHCVVLVGSSASRVVAGRFVTPRGYSWAPR